MKNTVRIVFLVLVIFIALSLVSCGSSSSKVSAEEFYKFSLKFNDIDFSVPADIAVFTDNGWSFPEKFNKLDKSLKPGSLETTYLESGENWFNIEIYNAGEAESPLKDCKIGRITYDFTGDIDVYTAGDFHLNGKTLKEVIAVYGQPMSQDDYSLYTEIIYDKNPESSLYDRYTFRFDKETGIVNYIDITNF